MAENPEPETTPVRSKGVLPFTGTALSGILSLKPFSFSRKRGTDLEEPCTTESTAKRSKRNSSSTEESQSPPRAAKITRQETPNPTSTSVTLRPKSLLTKVVDDPKKQPPPSTPQSPPSSSKSTPPAKSPPSTPTTVLAQAETCCNCTQISTCATIRCPCYRHSKNCTSCPSPVCKKDQRRRRQLKSKLRIPASAKTKSAEKSPLLCQAIPVDNEVINISESPSDSDPNPPASSPEPVPPSATQPQPSETQPQDGVEDTPPTTSTQQSTEQENPDLPGYVLTDSDKIFDRAFGDHIHQNDGSHLTGGVKGDRFWQESWRSLISLPQQLYDVPKGREGREFVALLRQELESIISRKSNGEKFLCFQTVILTRDRKVKKACDIKRRLVSRMLAWTEGKYTSLIADTIGTLQKNLSHLQGDTTQDHRARVFNHLVLKGEIRRAVRYLTDRESGGVLFPQDIDDKTGQPVSTVLQGKHPNAQPATLFAHQSSPLPEFLDVEVTDSTVASVASKLHGSPGLSGFDSNNLRFCLLRFGTTSARLRASVARFIRWLANDTPPWAAYRALMSCRLIALDKLPGV